MRPTAISSLVESRVSLILEGFDPISSLGFTQIPNAILQHRDLSPGAKITYSMLLKYAWEKDKCFPGQDRLADDIGISKRSVITYLKEIEAIGYLETKRRGRGLTNIYILKAKVRKGARGAKFALLEVK